MEHISRLTLPVDPSTLNSSLSSFPRLRLSTMKNLSTSRVKTLK